MPRSGRGQQRRFAVDPDDAWTPGDVAQIDAVVGACALVAEADGWVTADERRAVFDRMSKSPTIRLFGLQEVTTAFEVMSMRFDRNPEDGVTAAEAAVTGLRGQAAPSHLLIKMACLVAGGDGGVDAEERAVLLRLRRLLDLDPAHYDLNSGKGGCR